MSPMRPTPSTNRACSAEVAASGESPAVSTIASGLSIASVATTSVVLWSIARRRRSRDWAGFRRAGLGAAYTARRNPTSIASPSANAVGAVMAEPLTLVPLALPRSSIRQVVPSHVSLAWRRDRPGSGMERSAAAPRPRTADVLNVSSVPRCGPSVMVSVGMGRSPARRVSARRLVAAGRQRRHDRGDGAGESRWFRASGCRRPGPWRCHEAPRQSRQR